MKHLLKVLSAVFLAAAMLPSSIVLAQSVFRCNNDLSNLGDSKASVFHKCGEPLFKDSFCKQVEAPVASHAPSGGTVVNVLPCETVDEWTYNPGVGDFMTTLRFESGKLKSIKYGDRVK